MKTKEEIQCELIKVLNGLKITENDYEKIKNDLIEKFNPISINDVTVGSTVWAIGIDGKVLYKQIETDVEAYEVKRTNICYMTKKECENAKRLLRIKNQIKQYAIKASDILGKENQGRDGYYMLSLETNMCGDPYILPRRIGQACISEDSFTDGFKFNSYEDIQKVYDNINNDDLTFYMLNCY